MWLRGRRSSSRNRPGSDAGKIALVVGLGIAATALLAGGIVRLAAGHEAPEGLLLTLVPENAHATPGDGVPPSRIGWLREEGSLRVLTESFHSAAAPALDFDGRGFLFAGRREAAGPGKIWEARFDGSAPRAVTGGNGSPAEPARLPGGRIVYSDRPDPSGGPDPRARSLFSVAPDGSDPVRLTFGAHRDAAPRMLPDGRILFRRTLLPSGDEDNALWMTVHPDGTGVARVAGRDPEDFAREPTGAPAAIAGYRVVSAMPLGPRPAPRHLTSVVRTESRTGTLLCLDVYESGLPAVASLPRGSIAGVRISRIVGASGDPAAREAVGEAPVFPDGSFLVEVPADVPLRLQLLTKEGGTAASLDSGIWVRPNESRGCVGCHEDPLLSPENRQPLAVMHLPTSLVRALAPEGGDRGR
jgi:hypothetical protein